MHPQFSTLCLRPLRLERALPERRHLEVAHDPLQAQQQAIIDQPRVIDAIVIDQHDVRDRPELHQLRPVAIIPGEPRRLERQHGTGRPRADGGEQPLKAGPLGESAAGDAQIVVDRLDAMEAQFTGHIDEAILAAPTLRVIADLAGRRLTHVHERRPFQMVSGDLRAHRPPPHRGRHPPRWRAADRPTP